MPPWTHAMSKMALPAIGRVLFGGNFLPKQSLISFEKFRHGAAFEAPIYGNRSDRAGRKSLLARRA
jgi:hypothetical protein